MAHEPVLTPANGEDAADTLSAEIALAREKLDLRLRGRKPDGSPRREETREGDAYGGFPRSHTMRTLMRHPALVGVAVAAIFMAGPARLFGLATRAAAIWKMTAVFRH